MPPIRKAIIPAAGSGTRMLPATRVVRKEFFPIVERGGLVKPAIQLILEEAFESGIEEVCIVTAPGEEAYFRAYFSNVDDRLASAARNRPELDAAFALLSDYGKRIHFACQPAPEGYGDAVLCARAWTADDPALIMLGDHVYISRETRRCARQLLDAFEERRRPVSGVIRKNASDLWLFGAVAGTPTDSSPSVYAVSEIIEKPSVDLARQRLRIPGLPDDVYLCFFGLHAMTPELFDCLEALKKSGRKNRGEIQLTDAQAMMAERGAYYALEIAGEHFDFGVPEGYVRTVNAIAGQ